MFILVRSINMYVVLFFHVTRCGSISRRAFVGTETLCIATLPHSHRKIALKDSVGLEDREMLSQ